VNIRKRSLRFLASSTELDEEAVLVEDGVG